MLEGKKLEKLLWAEAVANAAYTLNRCPTKTLRSVTPEEMWSGKWPCVAYIRVFGNFAYAMVSDEKRDKHNAKGIKHMFIRYCEGTKVYMLMCLEIKKIKKCNDVVFMEDSGGIKKNLEMGLSRGNEGPTVVVMVDESSKSPLFDGGGQSVNDNE